MTTKNTKNTPKLMLLCQKWEESEAGWGTRPDGYSIHLNEVSLKAYIDAYLDSMPDEVQPEYSRPDGTPYWFEATKDQYEEVIAAYKNEHGKFKYGVYHWEKTYPGNSGTDGWNANR